MIELPRSTYYYRSTGVALGLDDDRLVGLIGDIQDEFPGYGYRRVTLELRARVHHINHKREIQWGQTPLILNYPVSRFFNFS